MAVLRDRQYALSYAVDDVRQVLEDNYGQFEYEFLQVLHAQLKRVVQGVEQEFLDRGDDVSLHSRQE